MIDHVTLPFCAEPMRLEDLDEVMRIEREAFAEAPWSASAYRHELTQNALAHYFVVRQRHTPLRDSLSRATRRFMWQKWLPVRKASAMQTQVASPRVLAYGGFWLMVDEAHISTIATARAWRGKHLGELLLVGMIDEAQRVGAVCVTLEVRASNTIAQNLYRKYRFNEEGRRRRYYSDNGEDALIMTTPRLDDTAYQQAWADLKGQLWERLRSNTNRVSPM